MSNILFVTSYYPPEIGAAQTRNRETAVRLARMGHQVTVLTTLPNYPTGVVPPEYRQKDRRRETIDGVNVVRVWSYTSPNSGYFRRILAMLSFGLLAGLTGARKVGHPDVIIIVSPPLFTSVAGRLLAWRKRCPYVFNVRDLWPESAVQMGALHNPAFIWLSERLEWSTYQHARAIWTVTNGQREILLQRGVPPEKVFWLPIGVDTKRFHPMSREQARAELGWDDVFTVLYAGTTGLAHDLGTLLEAAGRLRGETGIRFMLVGDGAAKSDLMAEAESMGLANVTFIPAQPLAKMPQIIAAADACVVPLRRLPIFEGALPSKMFEFMACARPVILAVEGEARDLAEGEAGAALFVEPGNPDALAEAIMHLYTHQSEGEELGARGQAYILSHLDLDRIVEQLEARLQTLANLPEPRHVPVATLGSETSGR
jgi:colanic acid biosynthesis glycosyl transferase WcaI